MSHEEVLPWSCAVPPSLLSTIQAGVMRTRYRDRALHKSPFDLVLYLQLLQRLRPRTVIEIGAYEGGSALWFADMLATTGEAGRILSRFSLYFELPIQRLAPDYRPATTPTPVAAEPRAVIAAS